MVTTTAKIGLIAGGILLSCQAYATDLPVKAIYPSQIPSSASIWSGFYAGANFGYGTPNVGDGLFSNSLSGVLGGGQLGYNWQTGSWVYGLEGDFQGSGERRSDSTSFFGSTLTADQSVPWFATIRGRLGYTWGPLLAYVTGGGGWGKYEINITANGATANMSATMPSWVVGGGLEWMFRPQWSAKLELLYMYSPSFSVSYNGVSADLWSDNPIIRAGVNYHF